MNREQRYSSPPLPADEARSLIVDIEHNGIDSQHIAVATASIDSPVAMARADQRALTRPARRVALGAGLGFVAGLAIGGGIALATDARAAQLMIPFAIVLTLLGGLAALYSRLSMHHEIADVDGGGRSIVSVDLANIDEDRRNDVARLINASTEHRGAS